MSLVQVFCEACNAVVAELPDTRGNRAWLAPALALAAHAGTAHDGHRMGVMVDGVDAAAMAPATTPDPIRVRFECVAGKQCGRPAAERSAEYSVVPAMVGACAVAFHSMHEGHPIEMWADGEKVHPPASWGTAT